MRSWVAMVTAAVGALTSLPFGAASVAAAGSTSTLQPGRDYVEPVGPHPLWYNEETLEKIRAAAAMGRGLDLISQNFVYPSQVIARPGTLLITPYGTCTAAFMFTAVQSGSLYLSTAGHCAGEGEEIIAAAAPNIVFGLGWVSDDSCDGYIERAMNSAATGPDCLDNPDYALIGFPLDIYEWVDSDVAVIGGPCGGAGAGTVLKYVGHGIATGVVPDSPRVGLMGGDAPGGKFLWAGLVSLGDSGGPVLSVENQLCPLHPGHAVGIISSILFLTPASPITTATWAWVVQNAAVTSVVNGDGMPGPIIRP